MHHYTLLLLVILAMTSCKTKYITKDNIQKEYITCTDTLLLHDSIVHRDSITIFAMGDTVIKECIRYRDKYKYIYKVKTDTVIRTDSIMVQLPASKALSKEPMGIIPTLLFSAMAGFVIAMFVIAFKYR
jgi:hypothetical protein